MEEQFGNENLHFVTKWGLIYRGSRYQSYTNSRGDFSDLHSHAKAWGILLACGYIKASLYMPGGPLASLLTVPQCSSHPCLTELQCLHCSKLDTPPNPSLNCSLCSKCKTVLSNWACLQDFLKPFFPQSCSPGLLTPTYPRFLNHYCLVPLALQKPWTE